MMTMQRPHVVSGEGNQTEVLRPITNGSVELGVDNYSYGERERRNGPSVVIQVSDKRTSFSLCIAILRYRLGE